MRRVPRIQTSLNFRASPCGLFPKRLCVNCSWDKSLAPVLSCRLFRGLVTGASPLVCADLNGNNNNQSILHFQLLSLSIDWFSSFMELKGDARMKSGYRESHNTWKQRCLSFTWWRRWGHRFLLRSATLKQLNSFLLIFTWARHIVWPGTKSYANSTSLQVRLSMKWQEGLLVGMIISIIGLDFRCTRYSGLHFSTCLQERIAGSFRKERLVINLW